MKTTLETSGEDVKIALVSSVFLDYVERVKEKRARISELSDLERKFSEIQHLKFGQEIELELLEQKGEDKSSTLVSSVFFYVLHSFRV